MWARVNQTLFNLVWNSKQSSSHAWQNNLITTVQIFTVVVREMASGRLTLHAMGLVYSTQLSLVPMLAVTFSIMKGIGIFNQIEPALQSWLAPLGPEGATITNQLIEFINNARLGVLGSIGMVLLFFSVSSLLNRLEANFNLIWHVQSNRSLTQRFSDFLSVVVMGSLLIFTATSFSNSSQVQEFVLWLSTTQPFGPFFKFITAQLPYLLTTMTFTFIYLVIPNTSVRFVSALVGGLVAGLLWQTGGWVFSLFMAGSSNLTAIYTTFAGLIMLILWLYVGWVITLVGTTIAFYHQNPEYLNPNGHSLELSSRMKEFTTLSALYWIGQHHYQRKEAWTIPQLAQKLGITFETMKLVILTLKDAGYLTQSNHTPPRFSPGCPFGVTPIIAALQSMRTAGERRYISMSQVAQDPIPKGLMERLEKARESVLQEMTIKEFVLGAPPGE